MRRKKGELLLLLLGILILLYPFLNNQLSRNNQSKVLNDYKNTIQQMPKQDVDEAFKRAEEYNKDLANHVQVGEEEKKTEINYLDMLNSKNLIGEISIPKINVNLPIYYGTEESVLARGVGHVKQTSMPVGGTSTHAVLVGHRGLPEAELFTNLDKMKKGDYFYLLVLNKKLIYQVDQIQVVEPYEVDNLEIIKGKDYVTLVTCTPYGVNSHRLLVRGIRRESDGTLSEEKKDSFVKDESTTKDKVETVKKEETSKSKPNYIIGYSMIFCTMTVILIILKKDKGQR